MQVIDDEGFVFGLVNIIDILVVLLVLAVAAAGVALVTASDDTVTHTQTVTVRTTPQTDYVVRAIPEGTVATQDVVRVVDTSVHQRNDSRFIMDITVTLRVTLDGNVPMYRDERVYVGRQLSLDLGTTIVDGTIIDVQPVETQR